MLRSKGLLMFDSMLELMSPLNPQSPEPLHVQLANELRDRIRQGEFTPGDRLPTERELVEAYDTSLSTVRLALGALKAEALIVAGHGRGTIVAKPPVRLEFRRFSSASRPPGSGPFKQACERVGMRGEVRMATVERKTADEELAYRLGIEPGDPVIRRSRLMLANGRVVQLFDAFFSAVLFGGTELDRPELTGGIHGALERTGYFPVRATEEVLARPASAEEASQLRLAVGAPVLVLTRTTHDGSGRVLEVSTLVAAWDANAFVYADMPAT